MRRTRGYNISVSIYDDDMAKANELIVMMNDNEIKSMSALMRRLIRDEYSRQTGEKS